MYEILKWTRGGGGGGGEGTYNVYFTAENLTSEIYILFNLIQYFPLFPSLYMINSYLPAKT